MFEREKIGEEILAEMDKNLRKNAFKNKVNRDESRVEAIRLLNKAAKNFEQVGHIKESEAITRLAEYIVKDRSIKIADFATDNITPEKGLKNLEEHGHMLNMSDDDSLIDIEEGVDNSFEEEFEEPEAEGKLLDEYLNNPEIADNIEFDVEEHLEDDHDEYDEYDDEEYDEEDEKEVPDLTNLFPKD